MNYFNLELQDGVAVVWLDQANEKVNSISPAMIDECSELFAQIADNSEIKAVVLISRKKDFVAGADLQAILPITQPGQWEAVTRRGHTLLNLIEQSPKPVVVALHGAAMGGGLEIALACQYRIASDDASTVFALPEVQLGLLPGGGGTQRLPQLIGIQNALDMMLTGKKIYAEKARKMGLIDRTVNQYALLRAAKQQALAMVDKKIVRPSKLDTKSKLLESTAIGRSIIFDQARKMVEKQTHGNYPAPYKIIECVEIGTKYGIKAGYEAEIRKFDELVVHPVSKQLTQLFFAMTAKKKNPLAPIVKPIEKIGILGAGFMGAGIAEVSALNNLPVIIKDIKNETLSSAKSSIWKTLSEKTKRGAMLPHHAEQIINRVDTQLDYAHFDKLDMVIEAVFEDLSIKQRVLAEVEANTRESCIFATNTSALPLKDIAANAKRPEQVIGMHYFSPVPKMPLLEIVVTDLTAQRVIATTFEVGIRQGKTCIVVKDGPGFYTTRILSPMLNEALLLIEEGCDILQIDECAQDTGFPVGPITLIDEVGIDVGAHVIGGELVQFFKARGGDAFKQSNLIADMFKAGYCGRKNRKGFYLYDPKTGKKEKGKVNPEIYTQFATAERVDMKNKDIRNRLLLMMTNEAMRCLEDGTLQSPTDGDIGAILGLGFPPFTGGPFRYVDSIGANKAVALLEKLAEKFGERFTPADILYEYAQTGKKFYQ